SQEQTISNILVDITSPPCKKLSLFHLYMALSRSVAELKTIQILCNFNDEIFLQAYNHELTEEDD
ncbi:hypothetical protein BDQ17DRAFT_1245054, partial [Cyathus striatus]